MENKNWKRQLFFLVALGLVLRLLWMYFAGNTFEGDGSRRLAACIKWSLNPVAYPGAFWFPGYFYYLGGLLYFIPEVVWLPRIITVLIATYSIVPFYLIVKSELDEKTAYYSAIVFTLLFLHIQMSSATMPEPIYISLTFTGIYFMLRFAATHARQHAFGFILCFALAQILRYDSWILAAIVLVWYYFKTRKVKTLAGLSLLLAIAPAIILLMAYRETGDPLAGIYHHLTRTEQGMEVLLTFASSVFFAAPFYLLPTLPVAFTALKTDKKLRLWCALFIPPLLNSMFENLTGLSNPVPRMFLLYSILLIPLYIVPVVRWLKTEKRIVFFLYTINALVLSGLFAYVIFVNDEGRWDRGFSQTGTYVKQNLTQGRLVIDHAQKDNVDLLLTAYCRLKPVPQDSLTGSGKVDIDATLFVNPNGSFNYQLFGATLTQNKVSHLVLYKGADLYKAQQADTAHQPYFSHKLFEQGNYAVYAVQ